MSLSQMVSQRKRLQEEFRRLMQKDQRCLDRLGDETDQVRLMSKRHQTRQTTIDELHEKLQETKDDMGRLEKENSSLKKRIEVATIQLDRQQKKVEEMGEVEENLRRMQQDNRQLRLDNKRMQESLREVTDKYEGEIGKARHSLAAERKLQELTEETRRLEVQLDKERSTVEILQNKIKSFEHSQLYLKKQLQQVNIKCHNMQSGMVDRRHLHQQILTLKTRLQASQDLSQKIQLQLKRQLQAKDDQLTSMQRQLQRTLAELAESALHLDLAKRMRQDTRRQLSPYEAYKMSGWGSPASSQVTTAHFHSNQSKSQHKSPPIISQDETRKFLQIVRRSRGSELSPSQRRCVDKIIKKARDL